MERIEAIGSNGAEPAAGGAARLGRVPQSASEVVVEFLEALASPDLERALELIDDDIVYTNVSLPTIRGRQAFTTGARRFYDSGLRFEVRIHRNVEKDGTVLNERTDALIRGRVRTQIWVCGVFEVRDGRITLWRDYFDWANVAAAVARGLVGALVPPLRAQFPAHAD
jgi:limonene-1,2-epoxide hydrolase